MRAPFGDPLDEDQEPDPEAQRAALDALMSPTPPPAIAPVKATGYGSDDAAGLARAQHNDESRRLADNTSNAMYATFARKPMPADKETSEAENLLERRKGADQQEALQGRQAAAAKNAERADPNSESSRMARLAIQRADPKMVQDLGPQWERMSHARLSELYGPDIMRHVLDQEAKRAHGLEKPLSPPPVVNVKQPSELDEEEQRARIAKLQRVPAPKGPKEVDPIREAQLKLRQEKFDYLKDQNKASGFEPDDPVHPKALQPAQASALADQRGGRDKINQTAQRLKAMYQANPRALPATEVMAQMQSLASELYPATAAAGGYGQLTGGHQHLLDAAVGDPATMQNYINSGRFPALLDELMHGTEVALATKAHSLGHHEAGASHMPAGMPDAPVKGLDQGEGGDIVMVMPPGGSKPVPVHRAKLKDALAAGGKQVPGG